MDILWIKDENLNESFKNQIQDLNACFFPENLKNGKYVFGEKQENPLRLILSQNGQVIAHLLAVERNVEGLNMVYVGEVCVKEELQGRGYGKQLLELFNKHFSSLLYDAAILCCEDKSEGFYIKCGWERIDIDLYMNGRKANGCVMVKDFSGKNIQSFDIGTSV